MSTTNGAIALPLASSHSLSLSLSSSISPRLPLHCTSVVSPSAGLVSLTLQPPPSNPYGFTSWRVVIGGYGIGNDLDLASGFGPPRRPVFVRFLDSAVLVAAGVDDDGAVSCEEFWEEVGREPTGITITRVVGALIGLLGRGSVADADFSRGKCEVGEAFWDEIRNHDLMPPDVDVMAEVNKDVADFVGGGCKGERPDWLEEPTPGVFTFPLFPKVRDADEAL